MLLQHLPLHAATFACSVTTAWAAALHTAAAAVAFEYCSTSGRQHSAAVVAYRPNAVHTVAASRSAAHSSAAAVPQRDYTSTAVRPVLKDKKWCRNNNKADVSEFDATQMSKQEQVLVRCRLEVRTLYCSLVLALCLNAFLPQ